MGRNFRAKQQTGKLSCFCREEKELLLWNKKLFCLFLSPFVILMLSCQPGAWLKHFLNFYWYTYIIVINLISEF